MTGFSRVAGGDGTDTWVWELKSVNGRGLDLRLRLPHGWDGLEISVRQKANEIFKRGSLQIALTLKAGPARTRLQVNPEVLTQVASLAAEAQAEFTGKGLAVEPARLDGLLALRGVMEVVDEEGDEAEHAAREAAVLEDLQAAFAALSVNRTEEGRRLADLSRELLDQIQRLAAAARETAAAQPGALGERLRARVAELLEDSPSLTEDRLSQEVALLASKADVREELDRLEAHLEAARELLDAGGPIGRKLDFLCQEFNREANTLCAKSADVALTRIGLDLKSAIDQLREQTQNIE